MGEICPLPPNRACSGLFGKFGSSSSGIHHNMSNIVKEGREGDKKARTHREHFRYLTLQILCNTEKPYGWLFFLETCV